MIYYVGEEEKNIPVEKEPYSKGSEGKIYKCGKEVYKIYYENALNEGYGNKENSHQYLLTVPTKQIILPEKLIYTTDRKYKGYSCRLIPGAKRKQTGITQLPSILFIKNLKILETDFDVLSEHYVLAQDVTPVNYILNRVTNEMTIIDPGRYKHHCLSTPDSYRSLNNNQLDSLITLLLYLDFIEYKPMNTKRKIQVLRDYIEKLKRKEDCRYSEFFEEQLKDFETVHEYAKSLKRYIK